jgi:hypothetical protein
MLISMLSNTHLQLPQWLKFSWTISSNSMEFPNVFSSTVIQLSQVIYDNNCSAFRAPNCISTFHIIPRLMIKLNLSTSVWKNICVALCLNENLIGFSGYHYLNGGTIHLTMVLLAWHPLMQSMLKIHPPYYLT